MLVQANFLTGPDSYGLDLPETLDPQPDLYGVVAIDGGGRQIAYRPRSRTSDPDRDPWLTHEFDLFRDRIRISVYRRLDGPRGLVAIWRLKGGELATFMDDQQQCGSDLEAGIRVVIANITVRTSPYGLPIIELRGPLSAGDVRDPTYRESIEFGPRDPSAEWPVVRIRREPAWAREGNNFWQGTSAAGASVTNVLRAHVECLGPREQASQLRQQAADIASSMAPL
jgi:hypothetical protein